VLQDKDLWLTDNERKNAAYYGIQSENTAKIRVGASDAVAATQSDRGCIRQPVALDFEILTDPVPFYQTGLTDRLSFELTRILRHRMIALNKSDVTWNCKVAEGCTDVV